MDAYSLYLDFIKEANAMAGGGAKLLGKALRAAKQVGTPAAQEGARTMSVTRAGPKLVKLPSAVEGGAPVLKIKQVSPAGQMPVMPTAGKNTALDTLRPAVMKAGPQLPKPKVPISAPAPAAPKKPGLLSWLAGRLRGPAQGAAPAAGEAVEHAGRPLIGAGGAWGIGTGMVGLGIGHAVSAPSYQNRM